LCYVVDDRPQEKYLNKYVRDQVCLTWRDLGIELLPNAGAVLDIINANKQNDLRECCSAMFKLWLEREPEASWRKLIVALNQLKKFHLAYSIEQLFLQSDTCSDLELISLGDHPAPQFHNFSLHSPRYQSEMHICATQAVSVQNNQLQTNHEEQRLHLGHYMQPTDTSFSQSYTTVFSNNNWIQPQYTSSNVFPIPNDTQHQFTQQQLSLGSYRHGDGIEPYSQDHSHTTFSKAMFPIDVNTGVLNFYCYVCIMQLLHMFVCIKTV